LCTLSVLILLLPSQREVPLDFGQNREWKMETGTENERKYLPRIAEFSFRKRNCSAQSVESKIVTELQLSDSFMSYHYSPFFLDFSVKTFLKINENGT
jgi:hypothetical protein